ncbi:MAG: cytochrome C biogenesis protein [Nanoarchaeota archaeon]|nr:cytochrome C biogenesis protein [Nanoarchaeota archaeon]|tara:strand:- start:1056 stop:1754 length:699 start_codon:yes stop_codon:yes gene_type:complete
MVSFISDVGTSFILGLLTPLTAVCVLPLYPAFLSYLANKVSPQKIPNQPPTEPQPLYKYGLMVVLGVVVFMLILGLIFTTVLKASLTKVIGIVSPIAFGILILISLLLIFNIDFAKYLPKAKTPQSEKPMRGAFLYGFFFGAIVIPCNPLFIAALFTSTVTTLDFVSNMVKFLSFGIGIGFPLLVFSAISTQASNSIIGFLSQHKRKINFLAGIAMFIISWYYLIFVFRIFS